MTDNIVLKNIADLIKSNNITPNKLLVSCNLQGNAYTKWKSGVAKPSLDALIKIANYFHVSLDYLVGRETSLLNTNSITTTPNANQTVNYDAPADWDKLDEIQRSRVNGIIQGMLMTDIHEKTRKSN